MAAEILNIEEFLSESKSIPIIDVRSPKEYNSGHIPNAINIPVFNNEERAKIGTIYKQIGKQEAIEAGTEIALVKKFYYISNLSSHTDKKALIHCWRGGLRSKKICEFYNQNGFDVKVLEGGYKNYRKYIRKDFSEKKPIYLIGGYTGSGKTKIIHQLKKIGKQTIDLENIASHKGSMFGHLGEDKQPTTEQFENNLFDFWNNLSADKEIFIEHESKRVGNVYLPDTFYEQMLNSTLLKLQIPKETRIKNIMNDYGHFDKKILKKIISRLSVHMGQEKSNIAIKALDKNDLKTVAEVTLNYYDSVYDKALIKHPVSKIININLTYIDPKNYLEIILKSIN